MHVCLHAHTPRISSQNCVRIHARTRVLNWTRRQAAWDVPLPAFPTGNLCQAELTAKPTQHSSLLGGAPPTLVLLLLPLAMWQAQGRDSFQKRRAMNENQKVYSTMGFLYRNNAK